MGRMIAMASVRHGRVVGDGMIVMRIPGGINGDVTLRQIVVGASIVTGWTVVMVG